MVADRTGARKPVIESIGQGPDGPVTIFLGEQIDDIVDTVELGNNFATPYQRHVIKNKIIVEGVPVDDEGKDHQEKDANNEIRSFS